MMQRIHASAIAFAEKAVILRGPSGAGKSDLALRLLDLGADLVADDQVELSRHGSDLMASPPAPLAGLMEVRGIGIVSVPFRAPIAVRLVCDLVAGAAVERMPERRTVEVLGVRLPLVQLCAFHASTAAALRLWLSGAMAPPTMAAE